MAADEVTEALVASMIASARRDETAARDLFRILAGLAAKDLLPPSGCAFVSETLDVLARGGSPLPQRRKPARKNSDRAILVEVERARAHTDLPTQEIHKNVGAKLGLEPSTVSKAASQARGQLRDIFERWVATGADREEAITKMAEYLKLPPAALLFLTRFQK
jgi:hypothetical protein